MPKRKPDPAILVLSYFETAPIEAAKLALSLAANVVQKRVLEAEPGRAVKKADRRKTREERPSETAQS